MQEYISPLSNQNVFCSQKEKRFLSSFFFFALQKKNVFSRWSVIHVWIIISAGGQGWLTFWLVSTIAWQWHYKLRTNFPQILHKAPDPIFESTGLFFQFQPTRVWMDEVGRKESEYQIKGGGDNEDSMSMSVACGVINTVDWRGRPSNPNVHGGTRASAFVLGMLSIS